MNCEDCIELSSITSISDNNSTNVTLNTSHCSSFCNEKVDPDINLKIRLMLIHTLQLTLRQNNLQTLCMYIYYSHKL